MINVQDKDNVIAALESSVFRKREQQLAQQPPSTRHESIACDSSLVRMQLSKRYGADLSSISIANEMVDISIAENTSTTAILTTTQD